MKINKLILILLSFIFSVTTIYSQNCYRQNYGFKDASKDGKVRYEYNDGSYYGYAEAGDTIRLKTVLYGKRKYKVFVKTLDNLQISSWRIIQNKKSTKLTKKIKNEKYGYTYKKNSNNKYIDSKGDVLDELGRKMQKGEYVKDESGKILDLRVVTNKEIISADTIYSRKVINEEVELYKGNDGSEMIKRIDKAKSVVIELIFAPGEDGGCYGVFLGNQRIKTKKAGKNW